jgi:hypothetical protein
MVASIGLKILYSSLYREYINHILFCKFFIYPPLLLCDLTLVWSVFHNIGVFVLGLYSTYMRKHAAFGLLNLAKLT